MKIINDLKEKIKLLFYDSHLPEVQEGNIIWAKRYDNEKEMLSIPEGHREGPYVIIHKDKKKVYGLKCGSNPKDNIYTRVKLSKELYGLNKDTYVYTAKLVLLNKERYEHYINNIFQEDLDNIHKSMDIYKIRTGNKIDVYPPDKIIYDFTEGDIVKYKGKDYYIYSADLQYYYLMPIYRTTNGDIDINNRKYSFDFDEEKIMKIPLNEKLQIENITDMKKRKLIKLYRAKAILSMKEKNTLKRGKLINYKDNMYYIYGEYEQTFLVYDIHRQNNESLFEIIINGCKYYTSFEENALPKEMECKILQSASEIEMEEIKKAKKSIKKLEKTPKVKKESYYKIMKEGAIIMDTSFEKYVIIKRSGNTIYFVSLDENKNMYFYDLTQMQTDISFTEYMEKFKYMFIKKEYSDKELSLSKAYKLK